MAAIFPHPTSMVAGGCGQSTFTLCLFSPHPPPTPPLLHYPSKPPPLLPLSMPNYLSKSGLALYKYSSLAQVHPNPQTTATKLSTFLPVFPSDPCRDSNSWKKDEPISEDYFNLLRISVRYGDVELAKAVHASILKVEEDTHLSNALIAAYLKLGIVTHAHRVFLSLLCPDVVSYTTMISGLAKSNCEEEAVDLFIEMRGVNIVPNEFSFVAILTACIRLSDLALGFQIHSLAMKMGYLDHIFVVNALMGLYSKAGCLDLVLNVFEKMPYRDIASWNTVLSSLVKELMYNRAFEFFQDMEGNDRFRVDQFTLSTLLVAAAGVLSWMGGREIHAHALKTGYESNLSVNNALLGFYTKCGQLKDVTNLFERMPVKDIITWTEIIRAYMEFGLIDLAVETFDKMPEKNCITYNALMAGYCQNGKGSSALIMFCQMVEQGFELTEFTLTSVINACGLLMDVKISEQIHGFVLKFGYESNDCVEAALLDMCTRCRRMADAEKMFYQLPSSKSTPILWTSMICGYSRNGQPEEAISLFCLSQSEGIVLDEVALAAVLGVCGTLGFQMIGEQIYCLAVKLGFLYDTAIGNATMSMYYKCGDMEDAFKIFNLMSIYDVVSWNSLMAGYVLHRQGDMALDMWLKMEKTGLQPDAVTFLVLISAYQHTKSNIVDDCRRLVLSMKITYGIEPTSEHYAAWVGVLGCWGLFEEAEEVINKMPVEPDASVWRALLDTSRINLNTKLGKRAAKQILALEPHDPSTYVLVSNLYSASGRWHCSEIVRDEMRKKGYRKRPIRSWIIHQNKVHSFYTRDKSHWQSKDIYSGLDILILECLKDGYVPDTSFVLQEVEEHQKKFFVFYHSAKLAVTYGLLTTRPGTPVRVMKNIHLCGDCHTFLKHVSIVTRREIHVRDASGFHCFLNGQCSCKDH
ncbi:hypothetical protein NMG60_11008356 [Bertholletia excelsa]